MTDRKGLAEELDAHLADYVALEDCSSEALALFVHEHANAITEALRSHEKMREALEAVAADCASTISSYERNGPGYTSPGTGVEYEHASFVQNKMHELLNHARTALQETDHGNA